MADVTDEEVKKPTKEVLVVQDFGFFQHVTGDKYDGNFEIKKKDKSLKMHGTGVYTTSEGDKYSGTWDADKLGFYDDTAVSFTDGARYEGSLKDWTYYGKGKYVYPDGSILSCDFAENVPTGILNLIDPNGHTWLGKADEGFVWFEPVNHFYEALEKTRDVKKTRSKSKNNDLEVVFPPHINAKVKRQTP